MPERTAVSSRWVSSILPSADCGRWKPPAFSRCIQIVKPPDCHCKIFTSFLPEHYIALPPTVDPAKITRFRLGVNSRADDITVSFHNIRIYYRR